MWNEVKLENDLFFPEGTKVYRQERAVCAISIEEDGNYHLSLSRKDRLPTYEELKEARYSLLPDVPYMAQIFPPLSEFVNVQKNCLHLFQIERKENE